MTTPLENQGYGGNRLKTGVEELDSMLFGGIPQGSQNLLIGESGSGKSLLAFHLLYNNAKQGKRCVYVAIDQKGSDVLRNVNSAFANIRDISPLMQSGALTIAEDTTNAQIKTKEDEMTFVAGVLKAVQDSNAQLVAVDSLSLLRALLEDDRSFTRIVNYMTQSFHELGVTSIITMEVPPDRGEMPGLFEQSMFDGVIKLVNTRNGTSVRHTASVQKMRYSKYDGSPITLDMTPNGIMATRSIQ